MARPPRSSISAARLPAISLAADMRRRGRERASAQRRRALRRRRAGRMSAVQRCRFLLRSVAVALRRESLGGIVARHQRAQVQSCTRVSARHERDVHCRRAPVHRPSGRALSVLWLHRRAPRAGRPVLRSPPGTRSGAPAWPRAHGWSVDPRGASESARQGPRAHEARHREDDARTRRVDLEMRVSTCCRAKLHLEPGIRSTTCAGGAGWGPLSRRRAISFRLEYFCGDEGVARVLAQAWSPPARSPARSAGRSSSIAPASRLVRPMAFSLHLLYEQALPAAGVEAAHRSRSSSPRVESGNQLRSASPRCGAAPMRSFMWGVVSACHSGKSALPASRQNSTRRVVLPLSSFSWTTFAYARPIGGGSRAAVPAARRARPPVRPPHRRARRARSRGSRRAPPGILRGCDKLSANSSSSALSELPRQGARAQRVVRS